MIDMALRCPVATGLLAFAYAVLIYWALGVFSRVGDE